MKTERPSIMVTGAAGSGGSYLLEFLSENLPGAHLHGLVRWHSTTANHNLAAIESQVSIHEVDLNDMSAVVRNLREIQPDIIFHLASHANVRAGFETPLAVVNNNVNSTLNLLEAIRLCELSPTIQICSTSEVYGQVTAEEVPIDENCPLRPTSPYAVSKTTQDLLGFAYWRSYGLAVIRTRMFAYFNPRRNDLFATSFALQIARIEQGLQTTLYHGNLESVRTLVDVRDAMRAYWLAATLGTPGEVYNIGGSTSITVGQLLDELIQQAKCEVRTEMDPKLLRPSDVTLQVPDTTKFRELTGWREEYSFEESVATLLEEARRKVRLQVAEFQVGSLANGKV